ncbi:hypothetical protein WA026_011231 [Henosepilachna vigintioctopunctata]|uniref:Uncharacterized protein n=1 Tax=Henosepilachna vigintioctopunctata TaxID=420089 RepID=A0AAW1U649_9CUCU
MKVLREFFAIFLCCFTFRAVFAHPTIYRYNEDKNLEPALIPVSSTVIPLPAYELGYGFKVRNARKKAGYSAKTLITVKTKKIEKQRQEESRT